MSDYFRQNRILTEFYDWTAWVILLPIELIIKEKIESIGKPLKEWNISINYGIKTGLNEAFIINKEKRNEIISRDPKSAEVIRPILRGRDIKRYSYNFEDLWLINLHNGNKEKHQKAVEINDFPEIKKHLDNFLPLLKKRSDKGDTPYHLRSCAYMEDFFRPKVMWKIIGSNINFRYDENGHFCNNAINIMTGNPLELLQFIGLMNSKIMNFYLKLTTTAEVQGGGIQMYSTVLEEIPVKLDFDSSFEDLIKQRLDGNIDMEDQISSFLNLHYNLTHDEIQFIESL